MTICCINVLYNKSYKDSPTMNYLLNSDFYLNGRVEIYVADNSTKDYSNKNLSIFKNVVYLDMQGNRGLSKAYNRAISEIKKRHRLKNTLIVLMDDDSLFPNDYFDTLMNSVDSKNDIYLPIVTINTGQIISPCREKRGFIKSIKDISEVNRNNISGINTGMAIKGNIFNDFSYNEELFLDYVDHDFMRYAKHRNLNIKITNSKIEQEFSLMTDNYKATVNRFKIYRKDIKTYYKKERFGLFHSFYLILYRKYEILYQFRKLQILFI